jgi:hypothetical protein
MAMGMLSLSSSLGCSLQAQQSHSTFEMARLQAKARGAPDNVLYVRVAYALRRHKKKHMGL